MSEAIRTVDGTVLPGVGTWSIDTSHSSINFTVRHMVVGKTRGHFASWSGTIEIADDPASSSVSIEIDPTSVETNDENRDNHLRSPDFFGVDAHPKITFQSTSVKGGGKQWLVAGDLAVHGVTRPVELELELEGVVEKDPWGFARAGFSGETEVDREGFGLVWNQVLETGGVLIGKTVKINFEVEAVKQG